MCAHNYAGSRTAETHPRVLDKLKMWKKQQLEEAGAAELLPSAWSLESFIILSNGPKINKLKTCQDTTALTSKYSQGKVYIAKQTQQGDAISLQHRTSFQSEAGETAKLSQEEQPSWKQVIYMFHAVSAGDSQGQESLPKDLPER